MNLHIDNIETQVTSLSNDETVWIARFLAFEDSSSAFYMSDGKAGFGETTTRRLFNQARRAFPTGLAALVYREARTKGFTVYIIDNRTKPAGFDESVDLEWLKTRKLTDGTPFQYDAVKRLAARTRGILAMSTGSGKGECAVGLMKAIPCRWLFLASGKDPLSNGLKRWEKRCPDEPVGMIGDSKWYGTDERIVFASPKTLYLRLNHPEHGPATRKLLESFGGLLIDECHSSAAAETYGVLMATTNAYYRVGMSATALSRSDKNMYVIAGLGEVIYRVRTAELIAAGWVSEPQVTMVPVTQSAPTKKTYGGAYNERISRSHTRNRVVVLMTQAADKPCMVFVRFKNHGRMLLKNMKKLGMRVEFRHGVHTAGQRDAAIEALEWGDLDVVISTSILGTGKDIPQLKSVVLAMGGESGIQVPQWLGRGMRVVYDEQGKLVKGTFQLWDVLDVDAKEKNPQTGRLRQTKMKWFADHSESRKQTYLSEGYPVTVLTPIEARAYGSTG